MDSSDVNAIVDSLADKIGIAADKLTPIAETVVREMHAYGVGLLLLAALLGAVAGTMAFVTAWCTKHIKESDYFVFGVTISGAIAIGCTIGAVATASNAVSPLTRPTWVALKSLL